MDVIGSEHSGLYRGSPLKVAVALEGQSIWVDRSGSRQGVTWVELRRDPARAQVGHMARNKWYR